MILNNKIIRFIKDSSKQLSLIRKSQGIILKIKTDNFDNTFSETKLRKAANLLHWSENDESLIVITWLVQKNHMLYKQVKKQGISYWFWSTALII